MTETNWHTDASGHKALVPHADRDTWRAHGWAPTKPPAGDDLVWLQHETHKGRQLFPFRAITEWRRLGWQPSDPPVPLNVTKDPQLVDVAEPAPTVEPEPTARAAATATSEEE